jgi:hypothetical protein
MKAMPSTLGGPNSLKKQDKPHRLMRIARTLRNNSEFNISRASEGQKALRTADQEIGATIQIQNLPMLDRVLTANAGYTLVPGKF